jgi:predicted HTH transcriptional regulator
LRRNGLSSRKDIDEELEGVEKNAIKVSLRRLVDTGKVVRMGGQGGDYAIKT